MHQPMSKFAVVGQQDQTLGVGIEPTHVKKLLVAPNSVLDQIADAGPAAVVRHRRVHAARLVQRQIHQRVIQDHPCPVDADHRGIRVDPGAQLGHQLSVDLDTAVDDHSLGNPPRRNSGLRQHFLQANPAGFAVGDHHS
jgi:hypothetical protein